jgi:hypothetical protein
VFVAALMVALLVTLVLSVGKPALCSLLGGNMSKSGRVCIGESGDGD